MAEVFSDTAGGQLFKNLTQIVRKQYPPEWAHADPYVHVGQARVTHSIGHCARESLHHSSTEWDAKPAKKALTLEDGIEIARANFAEAVADRLPADILAHPFDPLRAVFTEAGEDPTRCVVVVGVRAFDQSGGVTRAPPHDNPRGELRACVSERERQSP